jgi:hypothetical protein
MGLSRMLALILFYFKKEPKTLTEIAKYWKYIEQLEKLQVLDMPTIPLKFN